MADDTRQDERPVAGDGPEATPADAAVDLALRDEDSAAEDDLADDAAADDELPADDEVPDDAADDAPSVGARRRGLSRRRDRPAAERTTTDGGRRPRTSRALVPVLAALLVVLLAGTGYLFVTRPAASAVRTADYVDALQAARAGIVDVASFDYLTLDDDIEQIRSVTTGDLQSDSVDQLDSRRQDITDSQAVVNTEVVGAAVGAADDETATVYMVIQSTQTSTAAAQAQVQRYRIEVDLTKDGDRWLLSGITGR